MRKFFVLACLFLYAPTFSYAQDVPPSDTVVTSDTEAAPAATEEKPATEDSVEGPVESTIPEVTGSASESIDALKDVISTAKTGKWAAIGMAVIMLLMSLFKSPYLRFLWDKLPKPSRMYVPIVLGVLWGFFAAIVGGTSTLEAGLAGMAGLANVFLYGVEKRGKKASKT